MAETTCTFESCPHGPGIVEITRLVGDVRSDMRAMSDRMEARDLKMIEALTAVANQGARLDAHEGRLNHLAQDVENLFSRVNGLEEAVGKGGSTLSLVVENAVDKRISDQAKGLDEKLDKILSFVTLCTSRPAVLIASALAVMTVLGTVLDLWYHFEAVSRLWDIYKGTQA